MNLNAALSPKLDLAMSTNFINVNQRYSLESNSTAGLGSHLFGGPGTRDNGNVGPVSARRSTDTAPGRRATCGRSARSRT